MNVSISNNDLLKCLHSNEYESLLGSGSASIRKLNKSDHYRSTILSYRECHVIHCLNAFGYVNIRNIHVSLMGRERTITSVSYVRPITFGKLATMP